MRRRESGYAVLAVVAAMVAIAATVVVGWATLATRAQSDGLAQAQQAYLLALAAARPDSFQGLYQQLDSFPVDVRQSLVRQSREANQQFYLYAARNKLAELGIYKGKGKSTRLLFRAMASYCRRVATPAFCQQPPTSGYYGEILSYAFRDPPAKAEDCPGLTDILYQAK